MVGARASTTCATSTSPSRSACSSPSPGCPVRASPRWSTTSCYASLLAARLNGARTVPGRHQTDRRAGARSTRSCDIDQSPIGRTPRSNPATYTGVFDHVRKLFARPPRPRSAATSPGRFSFNVKGGRCEACAGDGTIKIEMHFLPDVYVPCEVCKGARYNRETLEVHFKGKTIADVLDMPIEEALDFFANQPAIARHLQTLVDVGPRLRPARASRRRRCPAARRSGSSSPRSCRSGPPGARCTSSTSRPRACTSRTSASCSRCSPGWSTRATR